FLRSYLRSATSEAPMRHYRRTGLSRPSELLRRRRLRLAVQIMSTIGAEGAAADAAGRYPTGEDGRALGVSSTAC
uniref:Uncharacterized protein n=1 Tax=Macrostomum lignano TaxID=282301 RepID=A0A1I8I3G0_9PLAT